ncbi:hypothetical protein C1H76_2670 [Elsinoe australis]|uniref:Uncharacterized protein n=1 Tax=Elsinoe australis TaxID=40998 RepID=A0A4U7B9X6_9PEZI|nr:hypothetical protein C1H76_2670 [Elsinoe australis]
MTIKTQNDTAEDATDGSVIVYATLYPDDSTATIGTIVNGFDNLSLPTCMSRCANTTYMGA